MSIYDVSKENWIARFAYIVGLGFRMVVPKKNSVAIFKEITRPHFEIVVRFLSDSLCVGRKKGPPVCVSSLS